MGGPTVLTPAPASYSLFRDRRVAERVAGEGYAQVPLLDAADVTELLEGYHALAPEGDEGLTVEYMRTDRGLVRRMTELLLPVWERRLPELLGDHRVAMTTFVVKHPGEESLMFLHDDRTFVDERLHRSVTLWVPLVDVAPGIPNGGLEIVPGSHRLPTGWSGSNTPELFRPFERYLRDRLVAPTVRAGAAVVYDTRLLHASGPNLTDAPRVAAVCAVAPVDAQLLHVVATGRRRRRVHAVDADFFLDHHPREIEVRMPSRYRVLEELDDERDLTVTDVVRVFGPDPLPEREPAVPDDLLAGGSIPHGRFEQRAAFAPGTCDVHLRAADLAGPVVDELLLRMDGSTGSAAAVALRRGFRRRRSPGALTPALVRAATRFAVDADLVVLDPAARLRVATPDPRGARVELAVLEAPATGAGVWSADAADELRPGRALLLPPRTEVTLWNQGPGPLVVAVTRAPRLVARRGTLRRLPRRQPPAPQATGTLPR